MEYNKEYVEKNLIAYIGNKRRLLPLINDAIKKAGCENGNKGKKFLDLFAGTGVVSRLAKSYQFEVHTNDWEWYSYIMNRAFIGLDNSIITRGFAKLGGLDSVLTLLNGIKTASEKDRYISEYYCPHNDETPDVDTERLFYTRYNGLKIDGIRAMIDTWYITGMINNDEQDLLIALLLYEASTRSNTSGVFKGFHRGFGGNNKDALSRIMKEITLVKPQLCDGKGFVYNEDALLVSQKLTNEKFDIVYLDPPYNQHQYGSNYHLLNTIAKNDKPEINKEFIIDGKKIHKSAIRRDWITTRSGFCYKDSAETEFNKIIQNINSNNIMVSYSTDGIIPFDSILDILSQKGKLNIVTSEYEKYKGGKQALTTELKNVEFIIMVDSRVSRTTHDMVDVKKDLLMNKIEVLLKKSFSEAALSKTGYSIEKNGGVSDNFKDYLTNHAHFIIKNAQVTDKEMILNNLINWDYKSLELLYDDIMTITSITKEDEIYLCLDMIADHYSDGNYEEIKPLFAKIPYYLSKFNNKKAFKASLRAIIEVLNVIEKTGIYWHNEDILHQTGFNKIETILLGKLNYNSAHEDDEIIGLKTVAGQKYDRLFELFSNSQISEKEYFCKRLAIQSSF